jgi:hypothetical protein
MNRALYAHWLDPEYLTWRAAQVFNMQHRLEKIESLLKMHAVLGDCLRLSDVQLTDSLAILSLFSGEQFRQFVEAYPDFLSLKGHPSHGFANLKSEKLAVIFKGLERARDLGWFSSTFPDATLVREIERQFRSVIDEEHAVQKCNSLLKASPDKLVSGLLYGLRHFSTFSNQVSVSKDSDSSFNKVLEQAEDCLIRQGSSPAKVQATLQFIEEHTHPGQRRKRTPAVLALHEAGLNNPSNRVVYFNIVQAWNIGVSNTLRASRDEAPAFEMVDPLPLYFGEFREAVLEMPTLTLADHEIMREVSMSDWHPAQLSWETIRRIRSEERCRAAIAAYQQKLVSGNDVDKEFQLLIETVASALADEQLAPIHNFAQLTTIGKDVGSILTYLGAGLAIANPTYGLVCLAGRVVASLPHDASKVLLWIKKKKSKPEIAAGIRDYAIRYNLHRWQEDTEISGESD